MTKNLNYIYDASIEMFTSSNIYSFSHKLSINKNKLRITYQHSGQSGVTHDNLRIYRICGLFVGYLN